MIEQISPSELERWFEQAGGGHLLLLDVREPWEVEHASPRETGLTVVTIPLGELHQRLHELNPAEPLACLCHHGVRSQRAALMLASQGFTCLANIVGGIEAWSQMRDPGVPRY